MTEQTDNARRQALFRQRQRDLGRSRAEYWVTTKERNALTRFLRKLRHAYRQAGKVVPPMPTGRQVRRNIGPTGGR